MEAVLRFSVFVFAAPQLRRTITDTAVSTEHAAPSSSRCRGQVDAGVARLVGRGAGALWGLLEGIERRRRALTGRSLFRQPLPSHRQRRLGGALCFPASCSLSPATAPDQGMAERQLRAQTTDAASLAVAVIIPTLAVGVPLEFSTDRKARPVLADRQGRWIPVAVIDEEVEYYNYNLDQVLPLA